MSTQLAAFTRGRRFGRIILDGGRLTGTSPGLQEIADAEVAKAGGDAVAALAALAGFTNGYVTFAQWPPPPGVVVGVTAATAAAWQEKLHPRDDAGKFARKPGGGFAPRDSSAQMRAAGFPPEFAGKVVLNMPKGSAVRTVGHALAALPAPVRKAVARRVDHITIGDMPEAIKADLPKDFVTAGAYTDALAGDPFDLYLSNGTEGDALTLVTVHEAFHAWADKFPAPYEDPDWQSLCSRIWDAYDAGASGVGAFAMDEEYYRGGLSGVSSNSRNEIMAQLAACLVTGRPMTLRNVAVFGQFGADLFDLPPLLPADLAANAADLLHRLGIRGPSSAVAAASGFRGCVAVVTPGGLRFLPLARGGDGHA